MSRVVRLVLVAGLAIAPLTVAARPAAAQSRSVQARDHVRAGLAYAERGKWEDALREFEEAYAVDPEPLRLYDVAQARLKTRRFRAARDAFTRLAESPGIAPELRDRARTGLAAAGEHIARLRVSIDAAKAGDTLTVDGAPITAGKSTEVDPGRRVVRLVRDGEPIGERAVDIIDGGDASVSIAPAPPPRAPDKALQPGLPPEPASGVPTLALALGGVALAAGGIGAYFEISGLNRWSELRDGCGRTKTCAPDDVTGARREMLVGDIVLGVAVVAAAAAIYVLIARPGEPRPSLSASPLGFTQTF